MFDPEKLGQLRDAIRERTAADAGLLEGLRAEVRTLTPEVRKVQKRSTTAISLVASDGGNNALVFDPFSVQLVRVVDSYGKELALDAISPTSDTGKLSAAQFNEDGSPKSALGKMMRALGAAQLSDLSHMIPKPVGSGDQTPPSPSWVLVYRDMCEWAVLYDRICNHEFATDTLIVRDGLLRSKIFRGTLFIRLKELIEARIDEVSRTDRRKVYLVGVAKHTKVLTRYGLAMKIENVFPSGGACFVRMPRAMEAKAYVWQEYARGTETEGEGGEAPKFVIGDMYFVRFGEMGLDPVWAVDILSSQSPAAQEVFGHLLSDAIDGFPVPFYPRCLQKAHEFAQVVGFDVDILQDEIFAAVKDLLPADKKDILEAARLQTDVSNLRYE